MTADALEQPQESASVLQPAFQIRRTAKIKEGFRQVVQLFQGQRANAAFLRGGEAAAAAAELPQGELQLSFLSSFLSSFLPTLLASFLQALLQALLPALPKDLLVGDAPAEVFQGDAAHGAVSRDRPAIESCDHDSGDHIGQGGGLRSASGLPADGGAALRHLLLGLHQQGQSPQQRRGLGISGGRGQLSEDQAPSLSRL